jgi:hypothetical protein
MRKILLGAVTAMILSGSAANAQLVATPEQITQMKGICQGLGVGFKFDSDTGQPKCTLPAPTAGQTAVPDVSVDATNLKNTVYVVFHNTTGFPVKSISCETWIMVSSTGTSYKNHNDVRSGGIPPNGIYIINSDKFQGYCVKAGDIVIHTSHGDFVGDLDGGAGNWNDSTELSVESK